MEAIINFLWNYWWVVMALGCVVIIGCVMVKKFINLPTNEQLEKVRQWAVYACMEAEKELGSGTGQLKMRYVYDLFLVKFSWLAKIMPYDSFVNIVEEALKKFKEMLETNEKVKEVIE